jgi:hypothetical protein
VYGDEALRRIFGLWVGAQRTGKNCVMRSFITYACHRAVCVRMIHSGNMRWVEHVRVR